MTSGPKSSRRNLEYGLATFVSVLQRHCACHEKVQPRHANACPCHAKQSLQSNISGISNLQPMHKLSVRTWNDNLTKHKVPAPATGEAFFKATMRANVFCDNHEPLCLPHILHRVEILAPAMQNTVWTSKNSPRPSICNGFGFRTALWLQRGVFFAER